MSVNSYNSRFRAETSTVKFQPEIRVFLVSKIKKNRKVVIKKTIVFEKRQSFF